MSPTVFITIGVIGLIYFGLQRWRSAPVDTSTTGKARFLAVLDTWGALDALNAAPGIAGNADSQKLLEDLKAAVLGGIVVQEQKTK